MKASAVPALHNRVQSFNPSDTRKRSGSHWIISCSLFSYGPGAPSCSDPVSRETLYSHDNMATGSRSNCTLQRCLFYHLVQQHTRFLFFPLTGSEKFPGKEAKWWMTPRALDLGWMDSGAATPVITIELTAGKAHLTKHTTIGSIFFVVFFFICVPKPTKRKVIFLKQPPQRLTRWVRATRKSCQEQVIVQSLAQGQTRLHGVVAQNIILV